MDVTGLKEKAEAWLRADPDPATVEELRGVLARGDWADMADRFAGDLEFGTAGLRGVMGAGPNRMNRAVVRRTTAGLARYLKATVPDVTTRGVVVGRDGRRLSAELAEDTACVLAAEGIPAHVFPQLAPTPLTAFACLHLNAAAAVMVTASHNPPEYNGYKVYWGNGAQIIPPHDRGIASFISKVEPANQVELLSPAEAHARGLWSDVPDSLGDAYLDAILKLRVHGRGSDSLSIVYTAMHGVGGVWMERAMKRAGFSHFHVVAEQQQPDGAFPTVRFPNPEEPGAMDLSTATAERVKAQLVLANDPDADRLAAMVRDGAGKLRMLTGNEVGVLLGHYVLVQGPTRRGKPHVITTIVSSTQLGAIAQELGVAYDEVLTGFKWIANRALEREKAEGTQFVFGYEEALGYTVGTVTRDKDGIGAALVFADLAAWCESRGTTVLGYLEEIQRRFGLYVSAQRNFTFPGAEGAQVISRIMEGFRRSPPTRVGELPVRSVLDYKKGEKLPPSNVLAFELEGGGRVTARPSGTEPKIKYYFELKETLGSGEPVEAARARGEARLRQFIDAFIALARERGQPEVGA
ncbi:phospho-sugar mutase [Archangium violaceum]|uniref:phospho-sugar mutase n=1 Tax=Archangium violaceum TaxID=83451 RepID=UPI0019510028|nr:phospho-sugar mutase [Archangium violaceum]QRN99779.1 phospho-sugar mutase [Archangium violaceum]